MHRTHPLSNPVLHAFKRARRFLTAFYLWWIFVFPNKLNAATVKKENCSGCKEKQTWKESALTINELKQVVYCILSFYFCLRFVLLF